MCELIRPIFFLINIFYFDSEDKQKKESVSVPISNNIVSMGNASEPKSEELKEIKEVLWKNAELPLFQELLLDAWDYHFYGNYRAAVIEAGTAFEAFVQNFIWKKYQQNGKIEREIEKILEAGLMNLLCHHIKKLTGHGFISTQEFCIWEMDAYKLRNDTIHKGKKISEDESSKAITTVSDTIKFIISLN